MICPVHVIMSTDVVKIFRIYRSIQWFANNISYCGYLRQPRWNLIMAGGAE